MKIIRSWRKSLSLSIGTDWELIIKAPYFTSEKTILSFIEKNKTWIEKAKSSVLEKSKNFVEWEEFYFLWNTYKLIFDEVSEKISFDWNNFYLNYKHKEKTREKFIIFYKTEASKHIKERVVILAREYNLDFRELRITSAKTRWWSCSSKKNLNFSFRLIMSPLETIDYVIIHELSHLLEMNHSQKFWSNVDNFFSKLNHGHYKKHQKWLKVNWNKLMYV